MSSSVGEYRNFQEEFRALRKMELNRFDLFAAAELGDVGMFERFFAQPHALEAALAVEEIITDDAIRDLVNNHILQRGVPVDAWVYLHDRATNIFHTVTYYHQYDIMRWLFKWRFTELVPKTLQFFLLDAASLAIQEKDPEMLQILLSSPLFTDSTRYADSTRTDILTILLRASIARQSEDTLSVLTAHGADWHAQLARDATPISEAALRDRTGAVVQYAIENGAVVVGDQDAIHRAAEFDNMEALLILLDGRADPRTKDRSSDTPLHRAAHEGLSRIAETILNMSSVDIDSRNNEGETALNVAVKENPEPEDTGDRDDSHVRVVEVLLRYGADTEISCRSAYGGYTPLRWAVSMLSVSIVRKLLMAGANPLTKFGQCNDTAADLLEYDMTDTAEEILHLLAQRWT